MKLNYQARTKAGDIQAGVVEAASKEAAIKVLQQSGLVVTYLNEAEKAPFYTKSMKFFERVGRAEVVLFSRELATMFRSEIPLVEALRSLTEETKNPAFKEKIFRISEDVEAGTSFSLALKFFPELFSPFYVNLVKAGEVSGKLAETLERLADHLEREYNLAEKLKTMMIYPMTVLVTFSGVLFFMMVKVIPSLSVIFTQEGQELPLLTRVVISLSYGFRKFFPLLVLGMVALFFFWRRYQQTEAGQKRIDAFLLKTPLLGSFLKMIYLSRFGENLSTLISGGLPIVSALEITAEVVGNRCYKKIILEARDGVRRGEMISLGLRRHAEYVPSFFTQMVLTGEKTGRLSETLMNMVKFYEVEVERKTNGFLSLLEPLLTIVLGGLVAVLIAAILMPMYQISGV